MQTVYFILQALYFKLHGELAGWRGGEEEEISNSSGEGLAQSLDVRTLKILYVHYTLYFVPNTYTYILYFISMRYISYFLLFMIFFILFLFHCKLDTRNCI